ncbi:CATRA conflict system CASPASE/TPR repeat-associated protein, partial [Frankia sp. CpI1-P]
MSQHSAETLTAHEFVAHLYAPTSSPRAVELYTYLRGLWSRCQVELGM